MALHPQTMEVIDSLLLMHAPVVFAFRSDSLEGYLRFMGYSEANIGALASGVEFEIMLAALGFSCLGSTCIENQMLVREAEVPSGNVSYFPIALRR